MLSAVFASAAAALWDGVGAWLVAAVGPFRRTAENGRHFKMKAPVNPPVPHAELIATFKRAKADAAHKQGLIKAVAAKGPKAIQTAVDTAAKAAKRRDAYAEKLTALGVVLKD